MKLSNLVQLNEKAMNQAVYSETMDKLQNKEKNKH